MSKPEAAPASSQPAPSNLVMRVLAALVLAPLAIALAYAGGWLWALLVTLVSIGLFAEWLMDHLAVQQQDIDPFPVPPPEEDEEDLFAGSLALAS